MEKNTPGPAEDPRDSQTSLDDFRKLYGEDFVKTIDLTTWEEDQNLAKLYAKIESELIEAKRDEQKNHQAFRESVFPEIKKRQGVPHAGLHDVVDMALIEKIHRGFLFNGAVTACSGVSAVYDSVPISITQIGVCLVNYQGQHGSYSHQLFRRDLRHRSDDHINEAIELVKRRQNDQNARLSSLALRGIKTFAERAILLERSGSNWLMGNGSPTPFELMAGFWASYPEMKNRSIGLMERMVLDHRRFVYVQECARNPKLWTLGNALRPFEYLVIDTLRDRLTEMVDTGGTRGQIRQDYAKFAGEVGSQIVFGIYRISKLSPPQIFYCHIDHIQTAALIAMADSALQMHSGTPMLLGLAGNICKNAFGKNDFIASIDQAYIRAEVLMKLNG